MGKSKCEAAQNSAYMGKKRAEEYKGKERNQGIDFRYFSPDENSDRQPEGISGNSEPGGYVGSCKRLSQKSGRTDKQAGFSIAKPCYCLLYTSKEVCLLDQVYVQDSDLTVAKYVEKIAKENNANVSVKRFIRFETGEGLEKKNEDFAAEVAAQMGQ